MPLGTGALSGLIDYAHNDYVQAFMEMGIAAPISIALFLGAYVARIVYLLRSERSRRFTVVRLGAGIGMVPLMFHSAFDFSMHMPAIAIWFATLAGVLFHPGIDASGKHKSVD